MKNLEIDETKQKINQSLEFPGWLEYQDEELLETTGSSLQAKEKAIERKIASLLIENAELPTWLCEGLSKTINEVRLEQVLREFQEGNQRLVGLAEGSNKLTATDEQKKRWKRLINKGKSEI